MTNEQTIVRAYAGLRNFCQLAPSSSVANKQPQEKLGPRGRAPVRVTPGLWKHNALDIALALVVDDFGVKFTNRKQAEHLIASLTSEGCKLSQERDGGRYCGLTLKSGLQNRHGQCLHARLRQTRPPTTPTSRADYP